MAAQVTVNKVVVRVIVRMKMTNLDQAVIDLHNIARTIEQEFGTCKLSVECRRIADTLSTLISPIKLSTAKGDQ